MSLYNQHCGTFEEVQADTTQVVSSTKWAGWDVKCQEMCDCGSRVRFGGHHYSLCMLFHSNQLDRVEEMAEEELHDQTSQHLFMERQQIRSLPQQ